MTVLRFDIKARTVKPAIQPAEKYQVFEDLKTVLYDYDLTSVAYTAKVSIQTLYNWIHGYTKYPRIDTLTKVANAVGFEINLELKQQRKHA